MKGDCGVPGPVPLPEQTQNDGRPLVLPGKPSFVTVPAHGERCLGPSNLGVNTLIVLVPPLT